MSAIVSAFPPPPPTGGQPVDVDDEIDGIIEPPPEIRLIADKTAQYVAKNGPLFEGKIMANNQANPKFRFMQEGDLFNPYYRQRVEEFKAEAAAPAAPTPAATPATAPAPAAAASEPAPSAGASAGAAAGAGEAANGEAGDAAAEPAAETVSKAAVEHPIQAARKRVDPEKPPPALNFTAPKPANVQPVQLDIIKLTAQYVAVSGVTFLYGLNARESKNAQFDFMKPSDPLFPYFKSLVEQYKMVLQPPPPLMDAARSVAESRSTLLERAVHRAEHNRLQQERRQLDDAQEDDERIAMLQIDWHDFAVVETITFDDDDAGAGAGAGASAGSGVAAVPVGGVEAEESDGEMEMDMEEGDEEGGVAAGAAAPAAAAADDDDDEQLKVVSSFKAAAPAGQSGLQFFIDPRTGEKVRINESAEHMRVNLLDPKWQEQRARAAAKHTTSGYTQESNIAENLKEFAANRPDVFGGDELAGAGAGAGAGAKKNPKKRTRDDLAGGSRQ